MASRYGRNKKRKHREMIADLQRQNDRVLKVKERYSNEVHRLEDEMRLLLEAIDAVQPLSAILPPKTIPMDPTDIRLVGYEYLEERGPRVQFRFDDDTTAYRGVPLKRCRQLLYEIIAHINNSDAYRKVIHLIAQAPYEKRVKAYFVDKVALRHSRSLPNVYEHITKKLVEELARDLAAAL